MGRINSRKLLHSGRPKRASYFRNENKCNISTDKLIGMLSLIYSFIISWFYEEKNKEKVMLNQLQSLI